MLILRGDPDEMAKVIHQQRRGLLAWLYNDGVLLIPADLQPPGDDGDDPLLRELERALTEPVQPWPVVLEPHLVIARRRRLPRWLSRRG